MSYNDLLNAGDDIVHAGLGDDTIYASTGDDLIDGGDGFDTLDYSNLSQKIIVTEELIASIAFDKRLSIETTDGINNTQLV